MLYVLPFLPLLVNELLFAFSFCLRAFGGPLDHAEDVVLAHNQILLIIELDLGAGVFSEEHAVTLFDIQGHALTAVDLLTSAYSDDLALLWFLSSRVRDDNAAADLLLLLDPSDDH